MLRLLDWAQQSWIASAQRVINVFWCKHHLDQKSCSAQIHCNVCKYLLIFLSTCLKHKAKHPDFRRNYYNSLRIKERSVGCRVKHTAYAHSARWQKNINTSGPTLSHYVTYAEPGGLWNCKKKNKKTVSFSSFCCIGCYFQGWEPLLFVSS